MALAPRLRGLCGESIKRKHSKRRRAFQALLESLERRTLMSVVVAADGKSATYFDVDDDFVTITTTRGQFTDDVFVSTPSAFGDQLLKIDLNSVNCRFGNITVKVQKSAGGDGLAAIGQILSPYSLGNVSVQGDLGDIDVAGDTPTCLRSLTVDSMGRYGADTGGDLTTDLLGRVGTIRVEHDVTGVAINIPGDSNPGFNVNSISIGGSLIGTSYYGSGSINVGGWGGVRNIFIGGDIVGGTEYTTGSIFTYFVGSLTIGGSIIGGSGDTSGFVMIDRNCGRFEIGGSIIGGVGVSSATINLPTRCGTFIVGGDLIGGVGNYSGSIGTTTMGMLDIGGDLAGGAGESSGFISATRINSARIRGSIIGDGNYSGGMNAETLVAISVGKDIAGGGGEFCGVINCTYLGSVSVGGSLYGGTGMSSGQIIGQTTVGSVFVRDNVVGGTGDGSGSIQGFSRLASVEIGGSIIGGAGGYCANITCNEGNIDQIKIGGDVKGGSGDSSALIFSGKNLGSMTIGGSLIGGSGYSAGVLWQSARSGLIRIGGNIVGGTGYFTAVIHGATGGVFVGGSLLGGTGGESGEIKNIDSDGFPKDLGPITIVHDIVGANADIDFPGHDASAYICATGKIASVKVGGSIMAGAILEPFSNLTKSASIRAVEGIGWIKVGGDIVGSATPDGVTPVIILVGSGKIGSVTASGRMERTLILAGYSMETETDVISDDATFANGCIGSVVVGGDMIASSIVASVSDAANDGFGDAGDTRVDGGDDSKINSIRVGGSVIGSASAGDHFGFVAGKIGGVSIHVAAVALSTGKDVKELDAINGDFTLREV